jgi:hypothetical protein
MTTHALLERTFDPPLAAEGVWAMAREGAWCFELHNVAWHGSFLAADGRRMVCWFSAPDLESARVALRKTNADVRGLWAGTVHDGPKPAQPNVLVERSFASPVRLEDIQAIEDAGAWCLEAQQVTFSHTIFSLDRKRMLCFYQAPDAEAVRIAQRKAGMPVDAVWAFSRVGPAPIPRSLA